MLETAHSCLGYGLDAGLVRQGVTGNGLLKWATTIWLLLNAVQKAQMF